MVENDIRFRRLGRREGFPRRSSGIRRLRGRHAGLPGHDPLPRPELRKSGRDRGRHPSISRSRSATAKSTPRRSTRPPLAAHLGTRDLPDPDLLIRTAGEMRISNFLLWQISYAELVVTDVLWPAFEISDLHQAFTDFGGRTRRFGLVDPSPRSEPPQRDPDRPHSTKTAGEQHSRDPAPRIANRHLWPPGVCSEPSGGVDLICSGPLPTLWCGRMFRSTSSTAGRCPG